MASIINASSTGSGGIVQTADASGVLQLQSNGTLALNVDTSANISVGTTTANTVAGNSNARYFAVQGDGTLSSADGRIILSNPRAYANISANTTTAGRVFFQLTNGSGGTITDAANIDAIASGSGGASGYCLDIRFVPKQDNGSSAEAARINFGGNLILKGGTSTASGTGVTFPATQSASTDANCLDDYEEGTFTPSLGGNTTYNGQSGNYIKIGKMVYVEIQIFVNSIGTGSTSIVSGLPFTTATQVTGARGGLNVNSFYSTAGNVGYIGVYVNSAATTVQFQSTTTAATSVATNGIFGNSTDVYFSGCYYAAN